MSFHVPSAGAVVHGATEQTPRERLIPGNERVIAPSGKTTWKIKVK
jgi:hypothetical protein